MNNILVEILFFIVNAIHVGAWIFILIGGFLNKQYAFWIIYYIIPFMYILQIFPEHPLETIKIKLLGKEKEKREKLYHPLFVLPILQKNLTELFFKKSIFNPVSHQGLMILGMIINIRIVLTTYK